MSQWSSGVSVLDLIFSQPETVSEIRFRNWYTARLSMLVRFEDSAQVAPKREHLAWAAAASLSLARLRGADTTEGINIGKHLMSSGRSPADWLVSIQNKFLMEDPHCESGSQDIVVISATSESQVPLHEVTAIRFLLRQPSPNWKTFSISGISVFKDAFTYKVGKIPGGLRKHQDLDRVSRASLGFKNPSSHSGSGEGSRVRGDDHDHHHQEGLAASGHPNSSNGRQDSEDECALKFLQEQTKAALTGHLKFQGGVTVTNSGNNLCYDVATLQIV